MNVKYFVSYLGLIPFLYLCLDGYYLEILQINFILDLSLLMSCIIFTFIGAYNWNFKVDQKWLELYGFLPSLLSMIILTMNILGFSKSYLLLLMVVFFLFSYYVNRVQYLYCI